MGHKPHSHHISLAHASHMSITGAVQATGAESKPAVLDKQYRVPPQALHTSKHMVAWFTRPKHAHQLGTARVWCTVPTTYQYKTKVWIIKMSLARSYSGYAIS